MAHSKKYSVVEEYCGHGIGREFHEEPQVVHKAKAGTGPVMKAGMTFTIEPGIYIPNLGGIRIEDDIFLEDSGATSLTTLSRELINI